MLLAIYVYDGMTALDAVGPFDLLNRLPGLRVCWVGDGVGMKTAQGGLRLNAEIDIADCSACDIVLIPGGRADALIAEMGNDRMRLWLERVAGGADWITSVCTGSLLLDSAGLLHGRRVTTHWRARSYFDRGDTVYVDERVVRDGNVLTAAGVSAGLDLALVLAELLAGREVAQAIQLSAHYDPKPPFPPVHFAAASDEILTLINDKLGPHDPGRK